MMDTMKFYDIMHRCKLDLRRACRDTRGAVQRELDLLHTIVSSNDDWDSYEGLQWYATAEYARTHPDDPDVPELIERVRKEKDAYLRLGRDTLGWAIYVFRSGTTVCTHAPKAAKSASAPVSAAV
jgi:hypothetical protein